MVLRHQTDWRWDGVELYPYKEDGTLFRDVTRQTLARGTANLPVQLRYFEVGPGGHTTLERHEHSHLVTIVRGCGHVLVGDLVSEIAEMDVVQILPSTWHQFRATQGKPLGFLCVVSEERDRPQRPDAEALSQICEDPLVKEFVRF